MNSAFRQRFALLVGAIAAMAILTLGAVHDSWTRVNALEHRLTGAQLESFNLASEFQNRLLALNNAMLHFAARRENTTWAEFEQSSAQLDRWIDEQRPRLNTQRERTVLDQLDTAYDGYLDAARQVHSNQQPATVSAEIFAQLDGFERQTQRLLQLGTQLADAHRVAKESFLDSANVALDRLRWFLFAGVALLLGLAAGLGWLLYRDLIAPLRTRLVQSEALLERQEKLATLGTLAAGIAHEIRNPLTSIKARLYTLGKHIRGNDPGLADAAIISGEITRLERIVRDVLQFARPSDPEFKTLCADQPLRDVLSLLSGTLDKSRVSLSIESGPERRVSIDPALIKQVLINLVRNAIEAIDTKGTVTLRVRGGRLKLRGQDQDVAILEVADTGKGIPPEVEKRLFDPFFTTKDAGTGLGLSIAARITEKHGGALQYQTHVGRGTTFGIVLPLAADPGDPKTK